MTTLAARRALTVPGPRDLPLVGPTVTATRFFNDATGVLRRLFREYGPIVALRAGGGTRIFSSDPHCPGSIAVYGPDLLRQTRAQHERFLPSRWETISPSPYEYSPFSVGPRMCIGATFALFEMKIVLAMLLQRHRLELPAGSQVDRYGFITLSPLGGLKMLAHPQDRQLRRGVGGVRGNVREMVELPA